MQIFISGSLAYDRIMNFPGHFAEHILPEKIHMLNVCFNISGLVEKFGGTAGNIAFTLAALGEKPHIVATSGEDFARYEGWLAQNRLSTTWIKRIPGVLTAGAYITTDLDDNQITAFNPGAMAYEADLPPLGGGNPEKSLVFIAPGNKTDMTGFAQRARDSGVPFFFDPGQSLNIWKGAELREAVAGAQCFISNDYELHLFLEMTNWKMDALYDRAEVVITTRGHEGVVLDRRGDKILIPAVPTTRVMDPTGAGDALRAGVLKGRKLGLPWDTSCQLGVTAASFAVEHYGTQEHQISWEIFCLRYEDTFGPLICGLQDTGAE
jgi:adenosine kinase